ncbi:hypothetical protein CKF54_01850 [Psittacicella hinzii]|uniref:tRNA (cytidine/uridine-2'-O-)-methyltransferase TrmJ n=1 Tax=Psittacicella hinzii TaxID=2028575 RepID=A0A3A1Y8J9_9GAMM|nr:RNA methyltransferase [Psittacicella hinzii]RIY33985.1 hypothetical protein CKF54_01850 [Psittacicella hinzii]
MINLDQFTFIYINTTHPGNLGSIARATKNMGISDVRLVAPLANVNDPQAVANAAGAKDTLASMRIFSDLEQALEDVNVIFATSARPRNLNPTIVTPEEIVTKAIEFNQNSPHKLKVAVLFGTEHSGLTNEQLNLANYHIIINANPEYSSLNLAMASLLIAYSLRVKVLETNKDNKLEQSQNTAQELASQADFHNYFTRLEEHYTQNGFIKHSKVIPRLQHIYKKAQLTKKEIDLLQGMLTADIKQKKE